MKLEDMDDSRLQTRSVQLRIIAQGVTSRSERLKRHAQL